MRTLAPIILLIALAACHKQSGTTGDYTLYQGSVVDHSLKRDLNHFNAPRAKQNCDATRNLFHDRPLGITQYYSCEAE